MRERDELGRALARVDHQVADLETEQVAVGPLSACS